MNRLAVAAALAVAIGAPAVARGQAPARPPVEPGGVATVVASVPDRAGADSVRFTLVPSADVRVFGRRAGTLRVDSGGARIPVTVGLPATAPAGRLTVGRLTLVWPDGSSDSLELAVDVAARRAVSFWIGAEALTTAPDAVLKAGYRLQNRGNAVDTFTVVVDGPHGWEARPHPATVALAPGDTAAGVIEIHAPASARPGEEHIVRVGLTGRDVRESRSVRAFVVGEEGWLGNVVHVPGAVFVGSSSDADGLPGVSLEAAGEARPGTHVSLALRHADGIEIAPALSGHLAGPRIRLAITTPDWELALGDVFAPASLLTGPVSQGRGVQAAVRHDGLTTELMVAAPLSYGLVGESGLVVRAATSLETTAGRFGVRAASVRRESPLFGRDERTGVAATWDFRRPGHELAVEAGLLAVADTGAGAAGFTGLARYLRTFERGTLAARLQTVPATTRASAGSGNEAFLSATFDLNAAASLVGWGFVGASPLAGGAPYAASRAGAAGVRLRLPLSVDAEALATYRETRTVGDTLPAGITRAARFTVGLPVRGIALEADGELGTVSTDATRPYRQLRAGARWAARREWAWLGVSHYDLGTGTPQTALDLAGAVGVRGADLQGGVNVPLAGAFAPSFWTTATVPVSRRLRLSLGVDHRPSSPSSPWRLSLGLARTFGMPLPLPRQAALQGRVFEDLNGNFAHDTGEPWLEGIALLMGPVRTRTDDDGRFTFHEATGSLRLDATALGAGHVIPARAVLAETGRIEVPLIRAATLELRIFLDRDGDREKDPIEEYAARAVVSLVDLSGRARDASTDEAGLVRFGSLPPGRYTVRVHGDTGGRTDEAPIEIPVELGPGQTLTTTMAVPLRRREVRFQ